jgi:hypothetical protein
VNGDTIYLPGGLIAPPTNINKRLVIIGAGHYPDSTAATGPTIISNTILLEENADGTQLYGMRINNDIWFADSKRVDSVVIGQCYPSRIIVAGNYDTTTNCRGLFVYGCVVGELSLNHATSPKVHNSIVNSIFGSPRNAWIRNNKISTAYNTQYALFENNTFGNLSWGIEQCTLRNNTLPFTPGQDYNQWFNNYYNVDWNGLFVNQTEWFNYSNNYHLKTPGVYLGTDGQQVGLYGGQVPYKDGGIPFNPHIQSKVIPLQTESNGQLPVQVKVAAQNN